MDQKFILFFYFKKLFLLNRSKSNDLKQNILSSMKHFTQKNMFSHSKFLCMVSRKKNLNHSVYIYKLFSCCCYKNSFFIFQDISLFHLCLFAKKLESCTQSSKPNKHFDYHQPCTIYLGVFLVI